MNPKDIYRKLVNWGFRLYLAAYLTVSGHVAYDFIRYNSQRIEQRQTTQILEVHRYRVRINEEENFLTLAGERHFYNQTEYELAQRLVDEHEHFADECSSDVLDDISLGNFLYGTLVATPLYVGNFYAHLGNGRWYPTIHGIAEGRGYKVYGLEDPNDPFDNMSGKEKVMFFGETILSALTAPLAYYEAKNEEPHDQSKYVNFRYRRALIDERDPVFANTIVQLLEEADIDELLVSVGRAHFDGVIENLSEQVELEEIE